MSVREVEVQGTSSLSTYATLYSTSGVEAIVSTIVVCNTGSAATFRVAVMDTAGTPAAANWRMYDVGIAANETMFFTIGLAMQNNRFIRVSSSANTVTFSCSVSETAV